MFSLFLLKVTEAIIKGISSSNDMFGGDLSVVVDLLEQILQIYNKDSEDVFSLTRNIYNILNTLLASFQAWTELTDFDQRYRLSTNILRIIDNTGFLFLSDHQLSASEKNQTNFSFEHLKVILDTIGPERSFSRCYDFDQVRIQHF